MASENDAQPTDAPPSPDQPPKQGLDAAQRQAYWRANITTIGILMLVWALVSLVAGILIVEQLNNVKVGELPLGFWFAQQGSIYVFVVLILIYAWRMDRIDRQFGVNE